MRKAYWEYTLEDLDKEIATTQAILDAHGYHKGMADHLFCLQAEREERLVEEEIVKGSRFATEVLQATEGVVEA
jgi:hypothetical protein